MAMTFKDLNTAVFSGDIRIDALVDDPFVWNFLPDGRNVLYYTFDDGVASVAQSHATAGVARFNPIQQQATHSILQHASALTGIMFVEVANSAQADVHFAATDVAAGYAGWTTNFYNFNRQENGTVTDLNAESIVYLDNVESAAANSKPVFGSASYQTLLHEVGHMLGLGHPFSPQSSTPLPSHLDNTNNTVMSYTKMGASKTHFQPYDVLALNWIYGGDGLGGSAGFNSPHGPSTTPTRYAGTALPDVFVSTKANEFFDGAGCIDRLILQGNRADYSLTKHSSGWQLIDTKKGLDATNTLVDIERLVFADKVLSLDLGINESAGRASLLLGAAMGPQALYNATLVGTVVKYFDGGASLQQAAQLLVDSGVLAQLAGGADNASFVRLVYHNTVGEWPSAPTQAALTEYLDTGLLSQADMFRTVAELPVNQQHIGLVGLQARGLEYIA